MDDWRDISGFFDWLMVVLTLTLSPRLNASTVLTFLTPLIFCSLVLSFKYLFLRIWFQPTSQILGVLKVLSFALRTPKSLKWELRILSLYVFLSFKNTQKIGNACFGLGAVGLVWRCVQGHPSRHHCILLVVGDYARMASPSPSSLGSPGGLMWTLDGVGVDPWVLTIYC